jgi:nitrogen fixation NifU-like protein
LRAFENLIIRDGNTDPSRLLGDLQFFRGVRKFPQRVKCAMLPWRALQQALEQGRANATVSTESDD